MVRFLRSAVFWGAGAYINLVWNGAVLIWGPALIRRNITYCKTWQNIYKIDLRYAGKFEKYFEVLNTV